jgi:predicted nucleic acid-binding protein
VSDIAYLDLCCLKRLFDDETIERTRREAEAVTAIMDMAEAGTIDVVHSPSHDFENNQNRRKDRRLATRLWLEAATISVQASRAIAERTLSLAALGFGMLDASHIAYAEAAHARWFITTDDRLLKLAARHRKQLRVEVVLPDQIALHMRGDLIHE